MRSILVKKVIFHQSTGSKLLHTRTKRSNSLICLTCKAVWFGLFFFDLFVTLEQMIFIRGCYL